MGKIKRNKYQYHLAAPKSTNSDSVDRNTYPQNLILLSSNPNEELCPKQIQSNVFGNIVIPPSALKQQLPPHSYTSSLQKKEKLLKIRESFPLSVDLKQKLIEQKKTPKKSRLCVAQVAAEIAEKNDEDEKKEVISDWKLLKDALPEPKPNPRCKKFLMSARQRRMALTGKQ